jgi:catechol 2,3-dioxygenase-like lactoylglutathione lyase family enzyme
MSDSAATDQVGQKWYARPVLFVSDVQRALRFYVDKLGFKKKWHEGDGKGTVCQVNRGECEIILCEDSTRHDRGPCLSSSLGTGSMSFDENWWSARYPIRKRGGVTT